jgi:hypothetical protein
MVVLTGSAYDLEDGPLAGESLRWRVLGMGEIGAGSEATVRFDAPGVYTATLRATDSTEMAGEDSVTLRVGPNRQIG